MIPVPSLALALALASATSARPVLVFRGNVALTEEVYRAVLTLPPNATATSSTAVSVRIKLLSFLHRAGYDLASVSTSIENRQIVADINEGRLDKIIFLHEDVYQQIRLRLAFSLPYNVFNRLILEREFKALSEQVGIVDAHWWLAPTERPEHIGWQLETLKPLPNVDLIRPEEGYELRIEIRRTEWDSGAGLDASVNGLEGVGVGAHYRDRSLLLDDDRWEASGRIAANLRSTIATQQTVPVLSAGLLEGRWYTPPLVGEYFRTYLDFRAYFLNRQRTDLGLEGFNQASFRASFNAGYSFIRELSLSIGAGVEHWRIFAVDRLMDPTLVSPAVDSVPSQQTRLFATARLELTFNPDEIRRDRAHSLALEAWSYQRSDNGESLRKAGLGYQKDFVLGWHELWIRSHGTVLWSTVLYPDEEPMGGDYLRGPFGGAYYLRQVAGLSLEFRLSLVRDLFKVSVYHDFAVFGAPNFAHTDVSPAAANAFGAGAHVLIVDAFQLDVYYGVGFATEHPVGRRGFDNGLTLALRQAY